LHVPQFNPICFPRSVIAQIDDIVDFNIVRANRQRIEPMGKAMSHLDEHALNTQSQIERGDTDGVESAAPHLRAFA